MSKLKTTMAKVESILNLWPKAKDNDKLLVSIYWAQQIHDDGGEVTKMSAWNLLKDLSDGKLTDSDTITRARRKLQETKPELRGAKYMARMEHQSNVKKELGYDNGN